MKPAPFAYSAPRSLEEALALLEAQGAEAKLLAGGQSLVPLMNLRLAKPRYLIDLNRITALDYIRPADSGIVVGAMTRQATLEHSNAAKQTAPLLVEAVKLVGHATIRHRGTVGGSLAHADPAAELPTATVALGAELIARGPRGSRSIPAERFFTGPLTTALEPAEILTEVRVPGWPAGTGYAFVELWRTHGNFAIVGVAALVVLDGGGRISRASLVLCGVGSTPVRARQAEASLIGQAPTDARLQEAARLVSGEVSPDSDVHASAEYRRRVARVYAQRALTLALKRARGGK